MSTPQPRGRSRALWQYHSRSDLHSKVACWGVLFDLLCESRLLRRHATRGKIVLAVNEKMRDFSTGREKTLDLVIARPSARMSQSAGSLAARAQAWGIVLSAAQQRQMSLLPDIYQGPVGAVLMALEAKATMTEHGKARPRLYDELNSSHLTVHGASRQALAVGLVMVNMASTFVSPDLNPNPPKPGRRATVSAHSQPEATEGVIEKIREIPRRSSTQGHGYDGLGLVVVDAPNDNVTPVKLVAAPPAPQQGDVLHYDTMITRVANEYDTRFVNI
ncbi:MAG TPA: hypothetical protein VF520_10995 [Thermoleophilaceae bacterium]